MKCNKCKYLENFYDFGSNFPIKYCTVKPEMTIDCEFYEPRR